MIEMRSFDRSNGYKGMVIRWLSMETNEYNNGSIDCMERNGYHTQLGINDG